MAIYRPEDLIGVALYASKARLTSFRKHLRSEGPHGTHACDYCNDFAIDLGLRPEPVLTAN